MFAGQFLIFLGARGAMNKLIFLITDGKQNLKTDLIDPVKTSQSLFAARVMIFALGVGSQVNKEELQDIVRVKNRVFYENTFDAILQEEFIKKVSKIILRAVVTRQYFRMFSFFYILKVHFYVQLPFYVDTGLKLNADKTFRKRK